MMKTKLILLGFAACFLINSANGLKCDKIVKIESTEILSYLGNVTFTAPGDVDGNWTLYLKTNIPFTFIGGWGVRVQSFAEKGLAVFENDESVQIQSGTIWCDTDVTTIMSTTKMSGDLTVVTSIRDTVSFRFRLHFGERNVIPHVKNIQWQNWQLCDGAFSDGFQREARERRFDARPSVKKSSAPNANGIDEDWEEDNNLRHRQRNPLQSNEFRRGGGK